MNKDITVAVGLSGGVDSSVAALLLKKQGYRVIGMFMKNWDEKDEEGNCSIEKDYEDVVKISKQLDIPFYTINFTKEYWDCVFEEFLKEINKGLTPNPDVLCNREIKFKAFLQKAMSLGADYLATGHYAQLIDNKLYKGKDPGKDQTYFLYAVGKEALEKSLFPIGHLHKKEVREIAKKHHLSNYSKKDSTGICFIGKRHFRPFLQKYLSAEPGAIVTVDGEEIGTHEGAIYYTIGQRKGLKIGGKGAAWFVAGKDIKQNRLIVAQGANHPALFAKTLTATDVHFIGEKPAFPLTCKAKIRYRQKEEPCFVEELNPDHLKVTFQTPQRAITPRQSIVFYDKDCCLGGAMIAN